MTTAIEKKMPQKEKWIDPSLFPFSSNFIQLKNGKMHYIDEGTGEIILFVHGTPTWSFLYRNQIKILSKKFRCIAIDHLGFGLSDKPAHFEGTPQAHAENLDEFIKKLSLNHFTLVVHDFGGPIGLSVANKYPERVDRIVLMNTWMWETKNNSEVQKIDKFINSWFGKWMYLNLNFSPKVLLKKGFFNKKLLTKNIHRHYLKVFPNKNSRLGLLKIAQSLLGSSDWYQNQWEQMDRIKNKPFLILWGMKDAFILPQYLEKWISQLTDYQLIELNSGHFVQEEVSQQVNKEIESFMP